MSETDESPIVSEIAERPILDRLSTFFEDYDAFYNEPVPMLASQLCADAHDEITSLLSQLDDARAKIRRQREIAEAALRLCNALPYSSEAGELEETICSLLSESSK